MDDATPRPLFATLARAITLVSFGARVAAGVAALTAPLLPHDGSWFVARAGSIAASASQPAEARRLAVERYARSVAAPEAVAAARRRGRASLMAGLPGAPLP